MNLIQAIRKLFRGEADSVDKNRLIHHSSVEEVMREQWNENSQADFLVGERIWSNIDDTLFSERKTAVWKWGIAAAVIGLVSVGGIFLMKEDSKTTPEFVTLYAAAATEVSLPDSSKVWMQPGSRITYEREFADNRDVSLEGDAVFKVKKHHGQPFKVDVKAAYIEVKGTTFSVSNPDGKANQVTLIEGSIEYHKGNSVVRLKPQQQLICSTKGDILVKDIHKIEWDGGGYRFDGIALDELIKLINTNAQDIVIEIDKGIPCNYLFTGSIRFDESKEEIAEKICFNLHLKYRKSNNRIILYR